MVTLVKDPFVKEGAVSRSECEHSHPGKSDPRRGYDGYVEPDTKLPPKANPVLADVSVNGVRIDEAIILAEAQLHPADNPGQALADATRALVVRELLLQKAQSLGLNANPQVFDNGKLETNEDALIRAVIESEVQTPVSDSETRRRYFDLNKHRFKSEPIYEARHILIAVRNEKTRQHKRELAEEILRYLEEHPADFDAAASEHSDCPSKKHGGNLGQITIGSTVPEFEAVLEKATPGQLWPELVESRFGFHILEPINCVPRKNLPFEAVEESIGAWLEASAWSRAVSQYISILAGKASITGVDLEAASSPLVQ